MATLNNNDLQVCDLHCEEDNIPVERVRDLPHRHASRAVML